MLAVMQVRLLGRRDYLPTAQAMQAFTSTRAADTEDELWLVEHEPVYTQGLAGRAEHLLDTRSIAVVQSNRGGQVTYHGPGQVVAYPLVDLDRLGIYVKEYVYRLEQSVLDVLGAYGVTGHRVRAAPGVFVRLDDPAAHACMDLPARDGDPFAGLGKIAALGIKVSRHCAYHGIALNVAMDLSPYDGINPCGYAGLRSVDLATLGVDASWADVAQQWALRLQALLSTPKHQSGTNQDDR
jgi:lipoyl(octanoyl) transferase